MSDASLRAPNNTRHVPLKLFAVALLVSIVGWFSCSEKSLGEDCGAECISWTEWRRGDVPTKRVATLKHISLTQRMIRGIAPGLRIALTNGDEYYILGPDVHKGPGPTSLKIPAGVYQRRNAGTTYTRVDQDRALGPPLHQLELRTVTETHLVGMRGFASLRGDKAQAFLRNLVADDGHRRIAALFSMFEATTDRSFSLYVGNREVALIRYPESAGLDAPWQFGELTASDFSLAFKEFREIDYGGDSLRREDVWVFNRDKWSQLRDVIGRQAGHSVRSDSDTAYIVLITDDFRAGETTQTAFVRDATDSSADRRGHRSEGSAFRQWVEQWWVGGPENHSPTSYHAQLVARWNAVGGQVRSLLTRDKIERVHFFARSRVTGRFIPLSSIENLSSPRQVNHFLGAFSRFDVETLSHLYSGTGVSSDPLVVAQAFVTDREISVDPRARIFVLDQPNVTPCTARGHLPLPGHRVRSATMQIGIVKGFLNRTGLDRLFSAVLGHETLGVDQCER